MIWDLGFIYGPALMVFYVLALVSIGFYSISRQGHNQRVGALRTGAIGGVAGTPAGA